MQRFELKVRLPRDVKDWLVEQVAENASSQTSEVVRAVRERMQRVQTERPPLSEVVRQSPTSEL
jgi:Arc/MetJ-type ribon-helix-helix transcriptional regulator